MTRSITIVNTSNWANEDYVVRQRSTYSPDIEPVETRIAPGEMVTFCPDNYDVEFEAVADVKEEPFLQRGGGQQQVWPHVVSWVGTAPRTRSG